MGDYIEGISTDLVNIDYVVPIGFTGAILYLIQENLKTWGYQVKGIFKMIHNLGIELYTCYHCVINDFRHSASGCEGKRDNNICYWCAAITYFPSSRNTIDCGASWDTSGASESSNLTSSNYISVWYLGTEERWWWRIFSGPSSDVSRYISWYSEDWSLILHQVHLIYIYIYIYIYFFFFLHSAQMKRVILDA